MSVPLIRTSRLTLRPFTENDIPELHRILGQDDILKYFPNPGPPPRERVQALIEKQIDHWAGHGYGWWAVEWNETRELIGWNGLQYLPETDEVEIGYLLSREYWGRGVATEGAKAGLDFGFKSLGLDLIVGIVHPQNYASQRVLEKIGLRRTGKAEYFGMRVYRYQIDTNEYLKGEQSKV